MFPCSNGAVHALPRNEEDPYDLNFCDARDTAAGRAVKFAIVIEPQPRIRGSLPYVAATAAAYGT